MPGERGLSLTELLVVVAILGVVAAVVVPSSATRVERPLDLAAQEVAEAFRFARNESLRLAAPHGVSEDTAAMSIRVFSLDEGVSPPSPVFDVYHPVRKQPYDVTLDGLALAGVDAVARSAVYRGTCNAPGDVYYGSNVLRKSVLGFR